MARYNFILPIQVLVENGLTDGDGEPLSKPLGTVELCLYVEADGMGDATVKLQRALQELLKGGQ